MCVGLLALGFTHHKGFPYQIIELEDSGLLQQGILPKGQDTISASAHFSQKRSTMATEVLGKKTLPTVQWKLEELTKHCMAREEFQYPIKAQHSQYHFFALLICRYDRVVLLSPNIGSSFFRWLLSARASKRGTYNKTAHEKVWLAWEISTSACVALCCYMHNTQPCLSSIWSAVRVVEGGILLDALCGLWERWVL